MKFKVVKIQPEMVLPTVPSEFFFSTENDGSEDINRYQVFNVISPYLKDDVGVQVVYSSPNFSGTPISKIEIITHMGKLLMMLERND